MDKGNKPVNNNSMTKKIMKGYMSPTPKKWRKLGDALLGVSSTMTGYAITQEMQEVALISLAIGVIGKFLSNFFSE